MLNIQAHIDDAEGFETARTMRWSEGVRCPECGSTKATIDGRDPTLAHRQRDSSPSGFRGRWQAERASVNAIGELGKSGGLC